MDRRGAVHLPRTPEAVAAHLVGDLFMGLYPLLPGNTCQFVVADFDGATAMLDAFAYVKAARASAVRLHHCMGTVDLPTPGSLGWITCH